MAYQLLDGRWIFVDRTRDILWDNQFEEAKMFLARSGSRSGSSSSKWYRVRMEYKEL